MSNKALTWAFNFPIKGAPKALLLALADHADDAGTCFPSVPRLALFAGTSDRGARKAIRQLEKIGIVRTVHATRKPSRYELVTGATTPEPRSASKRALPRNQVPPHPEPRSALTRNHVPFDPEPRSAEPLLNPHSEPPVNPQSRACTQGNGAAGLSTVRAAAPRQPRARRRKPETPIDPTWQPDAKGTAFAADKGITDLPGEVQHFRDHHLARGSRMHDWPAAWRTWCSNDRKFRERRGSSGNGRKQQRESKLGWLADHFGRGETS